MTKPSVNWSTRLAKRTQQMQRSSVREFVRLTRQPGVLSFAGGLPEPALFPVAEMAAAMETVWTHSAASALQYGETEGLAELRDWIAAMSQSLSVRFDTGWRGLAIFALKWRLSGKQCMDHRSQSENVVRRRRLAAG